MPRRESCCGRKASLMTMGGMMNNILLLANGKPNTLKTILKTELERRPDSFILPTPVPPCILM